MNERIPKFLSSIVALRTSGEGNVFKSGKYYNFCTNSIDFSRVNHTASVNAMGTDSRFGSEIDKRIP